MLSGRASAEPGRYRTVRTPYMREVMDRLSPCDPTHRIVFIKAAQVGATEAGNNWIGFAIHQALGPMLAVQPTVELAKRNSRQRIDPLIDESPELRERVKPARSRDAGNTMLSNSAVGLRSTPARYIFRDRLSAGDYGVKSFTTGGACAVGYWKESGAGAILGFMMTRLTRRTAILTSIASAIAAAGAAGFTSAVFAQSHLDSDQFLELSERLTGASDLDKDVATTLLGAFLATGHGPALVDLALPGPVPPSPLADAIVAAWYSGLYDSRHGTAVSDFNDALVWTALSFTKPFGSCGGSLGYWADPPEP